MIDVGRFAAHVHGLEKIDSTATTMDAMRERITFAPSAVSRFNPERVIQVTETSGLCRSHVQPARTKPRLPRHSSNARQILIVISTLIAIGCAKSDSGNQSNANPSAAPTVAAAIATNDLMPKLPAKSETAHDSSQSQETAEFLLSGGTRQQSVSIVKSGGVEVTNITLTVTSE
jgi:hypothetical protein